MVNMYLQEERIERMLWPANSPDFNPIENSWALLKEKIRQRNPVLKNLDELEVAAREEWAALPQQQIAAAIRNVNRRCLAVIRAHGGPIKY